MTVWLVLIAIGAIFNICKYACDKDARISNDLYKNRLRHTEQEMKEIKSQQKYKNLLDSQKNLTLREYQRSKAWSHFFACIIIVVILWIISGFYQNLFIAVVGHSFFCLGFYCLLFKNYRDLRIHSGEIKSRDYKRKEPILM